jgi:enoyl-CoA hydratase/carnithine racemase
VAGVARARRVFRSGEIFSAETALGLGLVDEVVPVESWIPRTREIETALSQTSCLL